MGSDSHLGHRKRVKKKFLENCGEDFNDHELLELLLFYSLPRKNTNEIAHTLIERFGSINNVACASVDELKMVEGVGNNSACLLKLVLSLAKRITKDSQESGKRLGTLRELVSYVSSYFMGATSEQTYIVLMDSSLRVIDVRLIAIGSIDEIKPLIRNILELVILKRATAVAIAHNHPRGGTEYSQADAEFTLILKRELEIIGARLVEHAILSADGYCPLLKELGETEGDDRLIDLATYY